VEKQNDEKIILLSTFRKKIADSEKNILRLLADSKSGNILDDVSLISTLEVAKQTAMDIEV